MRLIREIRIRIRIEKKDLDFQTFIGDSHSSSLSNVVTGARWTGDLNAEYRVDKETTFTNLNSK